MTMDEILKRFHELSVKFDGVSVKIGSLALIFIISLQVRKGNIKYGNFALHGSK